MRAWLTSLLLFVALPALAAAPPAPRVVDLTASDGTKLKATYYPAAKPGPGVILLHMCNTNRKSWEPLAPQLAVAGIHALALDYRGFGESGGEQFENDPQKQQQMMATKWPGDVDAAFAYLESQSGVDKTRMGAAGGSCGVHQAIQVARRHAEVKSLVLLAGGTDADGRHFLRQTHWLPIFGAAADDDQYSNDAPNSMRWLLDLSGNARNKFERYANGRHGTEIFPVHPELPRHIVTWFVDTLVKSPADPTAPVKAKKTAAAAFLEIVEQPGGIAKAAQMFHEARQRDPKAYLFPEGVMNQLGYDHLQAGHGLEAIELFKLNVEAYPASANAYDSLGDAYIATHQTELALQATQKTLELLPADPSPEPFKKMLREAAEKKLQTLKPAK